MNRCFLCGKEEKEETCDHILLHCEFTKAVWDLLFHFLVYLGAPIFKELLLSCHGSFVGRQGLKCSKPGLCVFYGPCAGEE